MHTVCTLYTLTTATNYFHAFCDTVNINTLKGISKIPIGNTAQVWLIPSLSLPHSHLMYAYQTNLLKKCHLSTQISRASEQSKFFQRQIMVYTLRLWWQWNSRAKIKVPIIGKKKELITSYCIMLLTRLNRSTTAIAELFQVKGLVFLMKLLLEIAVRFKLVP
jgi:hypothetical protein